MRIDFGVPLKKVEKEREVPKGLKTPSFFTSSPIYSKIGEVVAAQLAQASRVASSRSNRLLEEYSRGPKWAWVLFAPTFLLSTPPSDDGTCRIWDARYTQSSPRLYVPRPSDSVIG